MCLSNFIKFYNITGEFLIPGEKTHIQVTALPLMVSNTSLLILDYSRHQVRSPYY